MIQGDSGSLGREFLDNMGYAAKEMQTCLMLHVSTVASVVVLWLLEF